MTRHCRYSGSIPSRRSVAVWFVFVHWQLPFVKEVVELGGNSTIRTSAAILPMERHFVRAEQGSRVVHARGHAKYERDLTTRLTSISL